METNLESVQIAMEQDFDKNHQMKRLRREFEIPEVLDHIDANEIPRDFGIALMCQITLHKRMDIPTAVGMFHQVLQG